MTLVEMQSCLARLYANEAYRQWYYHDPAAALSSYELNEKETSAIRDIDSTMLEFFASTLVTKRQRRASRAYGASFAWHGTAMEQVFRRFLESYGVPPQPSIHHENVSFGRFAEQMVSDRQRFPAGAADLVRFERAAYEALFLRSAPAAHPTQPRGSLDDRFGLADGVIMEDFVYDVVDLDRMLREASGAPDAAHEPGLEGAPAGLAQESTASTRPRIGPATIEAVPMESSILFRPGRVTASQRLLRLNPATATVLRHCDGHRTAREVAKLVEQDLAASGLEGAVLDTLQRLQAGDVVVTGSRVTVP